MRTRRWTDGDVVWFAAVKLDATMGAAAQRLAYTRVGDDWCRRYPADVPHLDRAWFNFGRSADMMFRQAANPTSVPWQDALAELCRRTEGIDWWLTGSAAVAVRGGRVSPGDIDVVCSVDAARALGDAMADWLVEPVAPPDDGLGDQWGRAFHGARIEWVGGVRADIDDHVVGDVGATAAAALESVRWRAWDIRVPPLALQRAVSERRGLTERVAAIDELLVL